MKNKVILLKESRVERNFIFVLFNDILIQCKPVAGSPSEFTPASSSYELQRTLTLQPRPLPASLVLYPWILSDQLVLRLVDTDLILYLSQPSSASDHELHEWCNAINHRARV